MTNIKIYIKALRSSQYSQNWSLHQFPPLNITRIYLGSNLKLSSCLRLGRGSANVFKDGTESKYFGHCEHKRTWYNQR